MQLRVAAGVDGDLKQGREDVLQHLLEGPQLLLGVVHVTVGASTDVSACMRVEADYPQQCRVTGLTHKSRGTCTSQRTFLE